MDLQAAVETLGKGLLRREAAGLFAFSERRAMHRVRSYTNAALGPFADRSVQESVLLGHLHTSDGKVVLVEGFNGQDGARWAAKAADLLRANGLLAEGAVVRAETPLKACVHAVPR